MATPCYRYKLKRRSPTSSASKHLPQAPCLPSNTIASFHRCVSTPLQLMHACIHQHLSCPQTRHSISFIASSDDYEISESTISLNSSQQWRYQRRHLLCTLNFSSKISNVQLPFHMLANKQLLVSQRDHPFLSSINVCQF